MSQFQDVVMRGTVRPPLPVDASRRQIGERGQWMTPECRLRAMGRRVG